MWEQFVTFKTYFFIAFAILIPLLGYAVYLQFNQYKDIKKDIQDRKQQALDNYKGRQDDLKESLRIISMATIQEQCEVSEAALRLSKLLPLFDKIDHKDEDFKAIYDMYDAIKDLKYLEERNALNINERFAEDDIRYAAEEKFKSEILKSCEIIYTLTKNPEELH